MRFLKVLLSVEKFRKFQAKESKHHFSESAISVNVGSIQMNINLFDCL